MLGLLGSITPPCTNAGWAPVPRVLGSVTALPRTALLPQKSPRPARSCPFPDHEPQPRRTVAGPPQSALFCWVRGEGGCPPWIPSMLALSAGRGRHRSPSVVCYSSQLPPSPERFRRRVTQELECAEPPANRASCLRPRRGGSEGRAAGPAARHGTARSAMEQHGTAPHLVAQHGTALRGTTRQSVARCGMARGGTARDCTAWFCMAWHSMARCMAQHKALWHSAVVRGVVPHGTAQPHAHGPSLLSQG